MTLFFHRKPSLVEPGGLTFIVNALGRLAGGLQKFGQSLSHDTRWTNHATGQAGMELLTKDGTES